MKNESIFQLKQRCESRDWVWCDKSLSKRKQILYNARCMQQHLLYALATKEFSDNDYYHHLPLDFSRWWNNFSHFGNDRSNIQYFGFYSSYFTQMFLCIIHDHSCVHRSVYTGLCSVIENFGRWFGYWYYFNGCGTLCIAIFLRSNCIVCSDYCHLFGRYGSLGCK